MRFGGFFDVAHQKERLEEVTKELENPDIWNNPENAQKLGRERTQQHFSPILRFCTAGARLNI